MLQSRRGFLIGAGAVLTTAFVKDARSFKAEYRYYNFGDTTFTTGPAPIVGVRFRDDEHTVKAGLNYRFNWGRPAVAGY